MFPAGEYEFFDCKSDFSNSIYSTGMSTLAGFEEVHTTPGGTVGLDTMPDARRQAEEPPPSQEWHIPSLWELFEWGSTRMRSGRSSLRRQSSHQALHPSPRLLSALHLICPCIRREERTPTIPHRFKRLTQLSRITHAPPRQRRSIQDSHAF